MSNNDVDIQPVDQKLIDQIKELLAHAEAGKEEEVNNLLDELTTSRETSLYQELGKLTRELHEAFTDFSGDERLNAISNNEIKDARERLHFVISKTQQAADLTMTQVENSIPLCESIMQASNSLSSSWERLTKKEMGAQEFRELSKKIKVFLETANKDGETLKSNLNEVLMTQDFQDITGQVLYKVIKLVEDVEEALLKMITLASKHMSVVSDSDETEKNTQKQEKASLDGPVVPGVSDVKETVSGQDEVDDLLSSLGF